MRDLTNEILELIRRTSSSLPPDVEKRLRESIEKVQAMIEPVMTVIIGLILGWIMLAVLGPIYDIITKMKT